MMHHEEFACRGLGAPMFVPSETRPRYLPDSTFDTEHVKLVLDVDLRRRRLTGTCSTAVRILQSGARTLRFDAVAMKIRDARIAGRRLKVRHDGRVLEVLLPRTARAGDRLVLDLDYETTDPGAGVKFVGRPPQLWTQGQTDDTRCWFPCRDVPAEKATTEIVVTVPPGFLAVSNGRLVTRQGRTFHWKMDVPHSLYLVTLTVGRFSELRDSWDGVPVLYYCEKGREDDARRAFGKTPAMMDFFSRKTGVRYPYAKYAQIAAAGFPGGMENTSATTQTDIALFDAEAALDTDFDGLVAHELAHQWFGDLVTCADWSHAWLNESFATYFETLWTEQDRGRDEFLYELWRYASTYFEECSDYTRPTVTRKWRESFQVFDRHLYERGACFLRFIHQRLGDEAWWRGIRHYLLKHQYRDVETVDLVQALREATGVNLEAAFEEWLHRPGHPDLSAHASWEKGTLRLWIVQRDEKNLFSLPMGVRVDGDLHTIHLRDREHLFSFAKPKPPTIVTLDPEFHIPVKKVEWVKPAALWDRQMAADPSPIGRIEAAQAIAHRGNAAAARRLAAAFRRERFWGVQAEIARALGRMGIDAALDALLDLVSARHPKARRAVVAAIGEFRDGRSLPKLGAMLRDPSIHVRAEAVRSAGKTGKDGARAIVRRAWSMPSWNETIRSACVDALGTLEARLDALRPYLRPSQPTPVRLAAIRALPRIAKGDPRAARLLLDLAKEPVEHVKYTALMILSRMGDPSVVPELQRLAREDVNSRVRSTADRAARVLRMGLGERGPEPHPVKP